VAIGAPGRIKAIGAPGRLKDDCGLTALDGVFLAAATLALRVGMR
jgi:hypothetical protein